MFPGPPTTLGHPSWSLTVPRLHSPCLGFRGPGLPSFHERQTGHPSLQFASARPSRAGRSASSSPIGWGELRSPGFPALLGSRPYHPWNFSPSRGTNAPHIRIAVCLLNNQRFEVSTAEVLPSGLGSNVHINGARTEGNFVRTALRIHIPHCVDHMSRELRAQPVTQLPFEAPSASIPHFIQGLCDPRCRGWRRMASHFAVAAVSRSASEPGRPSVSCFGFDSSDRAPPLG